jgi:eukaryotic-like serine/threonine-protein kinase
MQETVVNNRYSIVRALGGGGMARVCLAHDEVLDRDVALKVLREQFADDEEFVERFKREARSAALSHLNLIQIYDRGETEDGASYIAMEYVPGRRSMNAFRGAGPWTRWSPPRSRCKSPRPTSATAMDEALEGDEATTDEASG